MNRPPHKQSYGKRARRRAEVLSNLDDVINCTRDLDLMIEVLLNATAKETGAERTRLLLNDERTNEIFTRSALGITSGEIRVPNDTGLAGHAFQNGESPIINDACADARFNTTVDKETWYKTRNILCVPLQTLDGEVIGAAQALSKTDGYFDVDGQACLEAMSTCAAKALHQAEFIECMKPPLIRAMNVFNTEGGVMASVGVSPYEQGETAARIALYLINGERCVADIAIQTSQQYVIALRRSALEKRNIQLLQVFEAFARSKHQQFHSLSSSGVKHVPY